MEREEKKRKKLNIQFKSQKKRKFVILSIKTSIFIEIVV